MRHRRLTELSCQGGIVATGECADIFRYWGVKLCLRAEVKSQASDLIGVNPASGSSTFLIWEYSEMESEVNSGT